MVDISAFLLNRISNLLGSRLNFQSEVYKNFPNAPKSGIVQDAEVVFAMRWIKRTIRSDVTTPTTALTTTETQTVEFASSNLFSEICSARNFTLA